MPEKCHRDPRDALVQDKFYTHLPDPLFDVIAETRLPAAAILVLLTHLKAGTINGNYCSEIPIEAVAARCRVSPSTVTRAYQLLTRLGLLRRADPGRDTTRPHQQAVAVTEFRLPATLVRELDRYPNRRRPPALSATSLLANSAPAEPTMSGQAPAPAPSAAMTDPFAGLSGRERLAAQATLLGCMSKAERERYDQAFLQHDPAMTFDADSALTAEQRGAVLQLLAIMARPKSPVASARAPCLPAGADSPRLRRRLSMLELARVRHGLQAACGSTDVDELCRQIVWSVEEGALAKFPSLHAVHIALKKVREGAWTRPHRMPPNWALSLAQRAPYSAASHHTGVRGEGAAGTSTPAAPAARQSASEPRGASGAIPSAQVLAGRYVPAKPH